MNRPPFPVAAVLLALGLTHCIAAPAAATVTSHAEAALFQPTFLTDVATMEAGKGFVMQPADCLHPVLVTALRLLGIGGSLPAQIAATELPTRVLGITIEHLVRPPLRLSLVAVSLTPTSAAPCCDESAERGAGDIAAFELPDSLAQFALLPAARPPASGEHVFLVTPAGTGRSAALRHEAIIQSRASGYLIYDFIEPELELEAAAGAPLVNGAGEVVALHVARERAGRVSGRSIATPVGRWLEPLRQACAAPAGSRDQLG
jgi:hypothetical protein